MNNERLQQLADYLKTKVKPERFSMHVYNDDFSTWATRTPAGTGCAARYITAIMDRNAFRRLQYKHKNNCYNSCLYDALLYIGLGVRDDRGEYHSGPNHKEFRWFFSDDWTEIDNTPTGAAARIEWYLQHGLPDNMSDQLDGIAPLCYIPIENQPKFYMPIRQMSA